LDTRLLYFIAPLAILEFQPAEEWTGQLTEELVAGTKVTFFNNGPIRIEGDFEIVDQTGQKFGLGGRTSVSVCRCGHSENQPFCDGTHKRHNFVSLIGARNLPEIPKT
jgi:CDGSH-type Zn-finger protein